MISSMEWCMPLYSPRVELDREKREDGRCPEADDTQRFLSQKMSILSPYLSGTAQPGRANGGYGYQSFPGEESRQDYAAQDYQQTRSASQTSRPPPENDLSESEAAHLFPERI